MMDSPPPDKESKPADGEKVRVDDGKSLLPDQFLAAKNECVAMTQLSIRMRFMRKVFGILAVHLLFTSLLGTVFIYVPVLKAVGREWTWLLLLGLGLSMGLLIAMYANRHEVPTNAILLALWTISQSFTVGVMVCFFDKDIVLEAFLLTGCVMAGLFFYALQTRRDFTSCGAGLFAMLWILIAGGIIELFLMSPTMDFVLSMVGSIVFSLFIIYDVQVVMRHVSAEEYILGTINLYLDIMILFRQMRCIVQYLRHDRRAPIVT